MNNFYNLKIKLNMSLSNKTFKNNATGEIVKVIAPQRLPLPEEI